MRLAEERSERDRILSIIEENRRLEEEKKAKIKHSNLRYQQGKTTSGYAEQGL